MRENLDDSEGSELSCSLPSSPSSISSSPPRSQSMSPPGPTVPSNSTINTFSRRLRNQEELNSSNIRLSESPILKPLESPDLRPLKSPDLQPLDQGEKLIERDEISSPDIFAESPIFSPPCTRPGTQMSNILSPIISRTRFKPSQDPPHEHEDDEDEDQDMFEDSPILRKSQSRRKTSQRPNLSRLVIKKI